MSLIKISEVITLLGYGQMLPDEGHALTWRTSYSQNNNFKFEKFSFMCLSLFSIVPSCMIL